MIDQWLQQLQSPDPEQRRQGIVALGKSKNPAALKHLAQIYRSDPEPNLRALARRAGQHIQQAMNTAPAQDISPSDPPSEPRRSVIHLIDEPEDEPSLDSMIGSSRYEPLLPEVETPPAYQSTYSPPIQPRDYEVSRENRERAKHYVEEALSMNMRGDNAKGMKMLSEALKFNPNLVTDSYFMSVAGTVTGLEGDGAIQMIRDSNQRDSFVKSQTQRKKQERIDKHLSQAQKSTWSSSLFEIILFTLITTIGPVLQVLITVENARAFINNLPPEILADPQVQASLSTLTTFNVSTLFVTGIVSGISGVIGLLVQVVLIHFAAVLLLGGHGTLRYMLELLLGYYNKWLPIIFFVSYIAITVAFISTFSPVMFCIILPLILLTLYVSGKTSSKIGEAYDFGVLQGCMAYFISVVILLVVSGVILMLTGQAFMTVLQGLIPQI